MTLISVNATEYATEPATKYTHDVCALGYQSLIADAHRCVRITLSGTLEFNNCSHVWNKDDRSIEGFFEFDYKTSKGSSFENAIRSLSLQAF